MEERSENVLNWKTSFRLKQDENRAPRCRRRERVLRVAHEVTGEVELR